MNIDEYQKAKEEQRKKILMYGGAITIGVIGLLILFFVGWPIYNVWASEKSGEAAFAKATQDRNIAILEATAKETAAKHNYNTTLIDAQAHADSIAIIGEQLKKNPDYLTYMWIQDTGDAGDETYIYVPSGEFGMPIQEAMRLNKPVAITAQA